MSRRLTIIAALGIPMSAFLVLHAVRWTVPGLYMDAVNPEYIASAVVNRLVSPDAAFAFVAPGNLLWGLFPLLPQYHHGSLTFYAALPAYAVLGTGLPGVRAGTAVMGLLVLGGAAALLRGARAPWPVVAGALLLLATHPAFLLNWRTQYTITALSAAPFLLGLGLLARAGSRPWMAIAGGAGLGLAAHGYFVWAFPALVAALVALMLLQGWRARLALPLGLALGLAPTAIGYLLAMIELGGPDAFATAFREALRGPGGAPAPLPPGARLAWGLATIWSAVTNDGNTFLAFGVTQAPLEAWQAWAAIGLLPPVLLVVLRPRWRPAALLVLGGLAGFLLLALVFGRRVQAHHFAGTPALLAALAGLGLAAAWGGGRAWRGIAGAALLFALAVNLAGWRATVALMDATGGRGTMSDAINRLGADLAARPRKPLLAMPDWGLTMPMALLGRGKVPLSHSVSMLQLRYRLCASMDAAIALIGDFERADAWERELGWTPARRTRYDQRDGTPFILLLDFSGTDWPANPPC